MADEAFRPRRPGQNTPAGDQDNGNTAMNMADTMRQMAAGEDAPLPQKQISEGPNAGSFQVTGNVPPAFQAAMQAAKQGNMPRQNFSQQGESQPNFKNVSNNISTSSHLKELLEGLKGSTTLYEEVELPSKGKFYAEGDGPSNGVVSIRAMTGEEEQILATPRFVKKGQAINMIFQKCLKENFRAENLLTIDRTYLLIYLRGISYSPNYDVEIKCPECDTKFSTSIDLNDLYVEYCPEDYGPVLQDVLPNTKLPFSYRLSTGKDEQDLQEHRDRRIRAFGDSSADDSLIYRTATLLNEIDGITSKNELEVLLKNLPISDVSYIRNCINEPPFGVDTNVEIVCPSCLAEFSLDLPLEANFFFPRRKKTKTQA